MRMKEDNCHQQSDPVRSIRHITCINSNISRCPINGRLHCSLQFVAGYLDLNNTVTIFKCCKPVRVPYCWVLLNSLEKALLTLLNGSFSDWTLDESDNLPINEMIVNIIWSSICKNYYWFMVSVISHKLLTYKMDSYILVSSTALDPSDEFQRIRRLLFVFRLQRKKANINQPESLDFLPINRFSMLIFASSSLGSKLEGSCNI